MNTHTARLALLMAAIVCPIAASGQLEKQVLKLDDLERIALEKNPTLKQAEAEARVAAGRKLQSGLWPNPSVGYSGEEIRGGSFGGGQQGFFVQQDFILGGKLGLNRKVAEEERRQAEEELREQKLRVLHGVRVRFYQALAAQELIAVKKELARIAKESAEYDRKLLNVGQKDESEVLQAEIEAEQADLETIAAEDTRRRAMTELAAACGNQSVQDATLAGTLDANLPSVDENQVLAGLLSESPAVRIAQAGVARAEAALARARREKIPDLTLRAGLQQNRELLEPSNRRVGLQGFAEAGIQLKLFDRNQGGIQAAEADLERARQEVQRVQLVLRERSGAFVADYHSARVAAERYRDQILPRARKAFELLNQRLGLMQAAYPTVLRAERGVYQAQATYVTSLERVWTSSAALEGYLLTDGLEAPAKTGDVDRPIRELYIPTGVRTMMP